jgi:nucleoside-diphosphate-sugar epimerase
VVDENAPGERVVVTGVSGFLGQRLLPLLDANPRVDRIIGLDVREPARRARKLEFHPVDILGASLTPYFRGATVVVHLAAVVGPMLDEALLTRVNVDGLRAALSAGSANGVRKVVRPSSAAVYGAWANNPVPITEDAPLRPSPAFLPAILDAECERLLVQWADAHDGRIATRLRLAPVVGAGAHSLFAAIAVGSAPTRVRGASPPVQVVHVDDAAAALDLAVTKDLDGAFNVAADGWLPGDEASALFPSRRLPGVPYDIAERVLTATWSTGWGDAPPSVLPYLVHPWVVANDRVKSAGWRPRHGNDEAILLATPTREPGIWPWLAGAGAVTAGVALGTWWLARAARRRRG